MTRDQDTDKTGTGVQRLTFLLQPYGIQQLQRTSMGGSKGGREVTPPVRGLTPTPPSPKKYAERNWTSGMKI